MATRSPIISAIRDSHVVRRAIGPVRAALRHLAQDSRSLALFAIACGAFGLLAWGSFPHLTYARLSWIVPVVLLAGAVCELLGYTRIGTSTILSKWTELLSGPLARNLLLLLFSLGLALLILFERWTTGIGHPFFTIGGLLPYSDASGYCFGATHLIEYGVLDAWNSLRRPLPIGFYAVIMRLTGQSFMLTMLVVTVLVALSVYYLARSVAGLFGVTAGLTATTLLFFFYYAWAGAFLTEPVGLIFGCLAIAFLVRGFAALEAASVLLGTVMMCLALACRAGAFFLIPILLLFSGRMFRGVGKFNIRFALICLAAAIVSLSSGSVLLKFIGSSGSGLQLTNMPHTLYGIAVGGKGWTQVYRDHPEIVGQPEDRQSAIVAGFVREELRRRPGIFLGTVGKTIVDNTIHPFQFLFPFSFPSSIPRFVLLIPILVTMCAPVFVKNPQQRRVVLLLLVSWVGILLSSPFMVDGGYRVYAATEGVNCVLAAAGCGILLEGIRARIGSLGSTSLRKGNSVEYRKSGLAYAASLILALLLGPLLVKAVHPRGKVTPSFTDSCKTAHLVYRASRNSYVHLVNDSTVATVPDVRMSAYLAGNPAVFMNNPVFASAKEGQYLVSALDLNDRLWVNILFDEDMCRYTRGLVWVCAELLGGHDGHDLLRGRVVHWDSEDVR